MKQKQAGFYNIDLGAFFFGAAIIGIVFGLLLSVTVPWVWSLVKPLLHALTA